MDVIEIWDQIADNKMKCPCCSEGKLKFYKRLTSMAKAIKCSHCGKTYFWTRYRFIGAWRIWV